MNFIAPVFFAAVGVVLLGGVAWMNRREYLPPRHPGLRRIWQLLDSPERIVHPHSVAVSGPFGAFVVDTRLRWLGLTLNGTDIQADRALGITDLDLRRVHVKAADITRGIVDKEGARQRERLREMLKKLESGT